MADAMDVDETAPIFEGVEFTIIPSDTIEDQDRLTQAIIAHGGRYVPLRSTDNHIEDFSALSHVVSDHIDFPQYAKVLEAGLYVVKPSWAVQSIQKRRQAGPRQHSPDPSQFFQDVVLSCADLPYSDVEAIAAGVIAMGGQFSAPMTKLVTHVVTTSLDHDKCRIVYAKRLDYCKIVLPHWFDDCFRLGKKISEKPYLFPDPEVLRYNNTPVKSYASPQLSGAVSAIPGNTLPRSPPQTPSKTRKSLSAFTAKKIFMSSDLQINEHLTKTLEIIIKQGGGSLVSDVQKADIYIGQYRDGDDYIAASREGKVVANLSWLYHVITLNRYTNPLSKLLHYPTPRNGITGFEKMKISVSNYLGDARAYLENLIQHCGAEYTKTMKQDNTHLITAHMQSEKCEAAQEWNIHIVNHLWLEESYAKCSVQTISNPRYTHFPTRTNLGEVTGQTAFDTKRLEHMYFRKPRSPRKPPKPSTQKPLPQSDHVATDPPILAPVVAADDEEGDIPTTKYDEPEPDREQSPTPATVKKPKGRPPKLATPRPVEEEKENELPARMSTGRASKAKAMDHLQKQASDIALFQKEMKRKGGVIHGGRPDAPQSPTVNPKKRPSDAYEATAQGSDLSDGETQKQPVKPSKKLKQTDNSSSSSSALPPIEIRMMVTGYDRWHGKAAKESVEKNKLRLLGILLTQDPKNVQILVAPRILRTKKFVAALACAPMVVNTTYLDVALNEDRLIEDPKSQLLRDSEAEERFGFKLAESLERAKINKHKLFQGWSILITKDVNGGFDTYKDIINVNGGVAIQYTGRAGTILPKRALGDENKEGDESAPGSSNSEGKEYDYVYLVCGNSPAETKIAKTFRDAAEKQGLGARVVGTDWVLNAAMRQEITWNEEWEKK